MTLHEDDVRDLRERMTHVHIARVEEMPRIELYLDQVLSFVSENLSFMALPGEELITSSMVNNYVKQRVIPAPQRRRYTRRHVASLIFVCTLKRVLSISEVKTLYNACVDRGVNVGVDEPVEREVSGIGNGPIAAFLNAVSNFGIEASVMDYVEHTMSVGTDAMAASYVECQIGEEDNTSIVWGVGIDTSIVTSSLKAIISAINRSER